MAMVRDAVQSFCKDIEFLPQGAEV